MQQTVLKNVRILEGGYCWQNKYFTGCRSISFRKFPATFLYFEHPVHGNAVVDTGYSPRFLEATRPFPERFYRWTTPVWGQKGFRQPDFFTRHEIDGNRVGHVFLSHLHADHIAGLCYYPSARIVYRKLSLEYYQNLSRLQQVRQGFLRELFPDHEGDRLDALEESDWSHAKETLSGFRVRDFWGDETLTLVDLPGHAPGHVGFLLRTEKTTIFYVADAYWDRTVLQSGRSIPYLSRCIQHDDAEYRQTQQRVRKILDVSGIQVIATHCLKNRIS